ncbi:MAG: hypothetical protein EOO89_05840 [Pedobacter sp.]|nr:MAG: hypothetical protein EOO89_05840 [Pedobacter sp.]
MKRTLQTICAIISIFISTQASSQTPEQAFKISVLNERRQPFENVIVEMLRSENKALVKTAITNNKGVVEFNVKVQGAHYFIVRAIGYGTKTTEPFAFPSATTQATVELAVASKNVEEVAVTARKQFIQRTQGKTLVNVDASVTNAGTNVLEVLEKSPGVMVDKNGSVSLQGKASVLILIDDKPTYLSGADLTNLLTGMSSSQVNQIELITNPSAKYDASGNAGIINIKTKKNLQEGFNGTFSTTFGHGRYYKNNNSLNLNLRKGKFNTFLNYSANFNKGFTDIYAYRQYFGPGGNLSSILDQPTYLTSANTGNMIKTGADFFASENTTIGLTITGNLSTRKGNGEATATWLAPSGVIDSAIGTYSNSDYKLKNLGGNLNLRHKINKKQEISFDLDALNYALQNDQEFTNKLLAAGGYTTGSLGDIPSSIRIFSAKTDHSFQVGKSVKLESGFKSSAISTDNIADYLAFNGTTWQQDLNKSNHFKYRENINSLYSSIDFRHKRISGQLGLRYENTHYKGNQLGNSLQPDSVFSKNYSSLFPSGNFTVQADSANSFSITAGRRIDRPAYQKLNPFVFIINKYTHQQGNPFFLPQYSWNMEVSHSWKDKVITTVSYSNTKNYFSQLFYSKGNDILVYTDGNVGSAYNIGASLFAQFQLFKWWSVSGQSVFNHKKLSGYNNINYTSTVNQLHTTMNNQFRVNKTLTAELTGFYTTQARNDLQELLTPTGQLSIGFSQTILKGKGSLRLTARDVFYTQAMEGDTDFPNAAEYFILLRDTRVINLGFNYRFGKPLKATRRSTGGATDEMNRAGS